MTADVSPSVSLARSQSDAPGRSPHHNATPSPSSSRPSTGASPGLTTSHALPLPSPTPFHSRPNPLTIVANRDHEQHDLTKLNSPGQSSLQGPTISEAGDPERPRHIVTIQRSRDPTRFPPTVGTITRTTPPVRRGSDSSQRTFASATTDAHGRRMSSGGGASPPLDKQRKRTTIKAKTGVWELGKTIGAGSMGKVKLARHQVTHEQVAVKIVPRTSTDDHKTPQERERAERSKEIRTAREAAIVTLVNHPYICGMRDVVRTQQHWYMLFEYVNGGQMLDYIISHGRLKEKQARKFARQIASALDYCHRNSLVHRDLKIENILISKTGDIKIIDFGLSNTFSPKSHLKTFCGSLYFAAPELLQAKEYTGPEVDIWSFGIVLYVLVCGKVPFDDQSMQNLHAKIKKGHVDYPPWLGGECRSLIGRMLTVDPTQRATMIEIVNHPWMTKTFGGPPDNFLPIRKPLTTPLDRNVIRKMDGFDFGTASDLEKKLYKTVDSEEYKRAAKEMNRRSYSAVPPTPDSDRKRGVFDFYKRRSSTSRDALTTPSSSETMQTPIVLDTTLAFSPLISVYYLAKEKLERETLAKEMADREAAEKQEKDKEAKEIRDRLVDEGKEISQRKERAQRALQEKVAAEQREKAKKEAQEKAIKDAKESKERESKEAKEKVAREAKEAKEKIAREAREAKEEQHRKAREAKEKLEREQKELERLKRQHEREQKEAADREKKEFEREKKEYERAQKEFEREQKEAAERERKELEREKKEFDRAQKEFEREQKEAIERDRKERQEREKREKGTSPLRIPWIFGDRTNSQAAEVTPPPAAHTNPAAHEMEGETIGGRTRPRARTQGDEQGTEHTPTKLQGAAGAAAGLLRRISTRRPKEPEIRDKTPAPAEVPEGTPSVEITSPTDKAEEKETVEPVSGRLKKTFSLRRRHATLVSPGSAVEQSPSMDALAAATGPSNGPAIAVSPGSVIDPSPSLLEPSVAAKSSKSQLAVGLGRSFSVNSADFRIPQKFRRGTSEDSSRPANLMQLGLQTNGDHSQGSNVDLAGDPRSAPPANSSKTSLGRRESVRNGRLQKRRQPTRQSPEETSMPTSQQQKDLDGNDDGSAAGLDGAGSVKPVYLKGLFSVSTTSSKPFRDIEADISRVLDRLAIQHTSNGKCFRCTHFPSIDLGQFANDEVVQQPTTPKTPGSSVNHRRKISFGGLMGAGDREKNDEERTKQQQGPHTAQVASTHDSIGVTTGGLRSYENSEGSDVEICEEQPVSSPVTAIPGKPAGETSTHVQSDMGTHMVLRFEIFIVKVPLFNLHGIQFKKTTGNTWQYKNMAQKILQELKL